METVEATAGLRCRRCRTWVMDYSSLLQMSKESDAAAKCHIWHVNFDPLPDWIHRVVHQAQWTKGKLLCPHCGARLGGFDFMRRASCPCGRQLTIHLSDSRVDRDHRLTIPLSDTWVPRDHKHPRKEVRHLEGVCLSTTPMGLPKKAPSAAPQLMQGTEPSGLAEPLPAYRMTGEEASLHGPATTPMRQRLPSQSSTEGGGREGDGPGEQRCGRRERNYMRSLRRKLRGREKGLHNRRLEQQQGSTGNASSSDEDGAGRDREGLTCAVCLDIYFSPYMCHPCGHVFCEPCLRTLARNCPSSTPCPLCRTPISHVCFQSELNHASRSCFPEEYVSRKQNFQKANCARWPLPSCGKIFRILGFRRHGRPVTWRQFPHGASQLDSLAFEGDSRGWRLDMDVLIIYIYSVNWFVGFIIFCFICYYFFSSL